MTLETELQVFLYNHNQVKEYKKELAQIFNKTAVEEVVKNKINEKINKLDPENRKKARQVTTFSAGSTSAFSQTDDWTMLALLFFADDNNFGSKVKLFGVSENPKINNKFNYDQPQKTDVMPILAGSYDIISHMVFGEAVKGTDVNSVYLTFEIATAEETNNNLSQEEIEIAKKWYKKAVKYPLFCGPSTRGAKAYYASHTTPELITEEIAEKKSNLLNVKELEDRNMFEKPLSTLIPNAHPLLPVFAMLSVLTGIYGHHTLFEVLSGAVCVHEGLTLDNCGAQWLRILGTYPKGKDDKEIIENKLSLSPKLNQEIEQFVNRYENYDPHNKSESGKAR
ncbi:hypothetical protein [Laspinema olomoucense]|uniref:Uncharacterized protein n=1 Tax=Laspinema olomoucense D3b TaxID=2953688 RepID=A0ABT2NAU2_9CYAN|nr:hypothetical protein [Laspinema sp. D3b]MCT7979819.1 hypothetical protein [Laspinema sp. D3b]